MAHRVVVLSLYKNYLRTLKTFPGRSTVIKKLTYNIKESFRLRKSLPLSSNQIYINEAQKHLQVLQKLSTIDAAILETLLQRDNIIPSLGEAQNDTKSKNTIS